MKSVENLRAYLQAGFQQDLLDAAVQSALAVKNPVRLNNFSTNFRELVRHVFHHLAPDGEIKKCAWFVPVKDSKTGGVTRGHRVSYVIHGGISPKYVADEFDIDVNSERRRLIAAVDRLSKFTHVNPETFNVSNNVEEFVAGACEALMSLLIAAGDARKALSEAIEERVHDEVVEAVLSETVMSVDEIATHHTIERVMLEQIEVATIGPSEIEFIAYGTVEVTLQWGSNSDVRNDMGAVLDDSFPLTMKFFASVDSPSEVEAVEDSLLVDTSEWYDNYYDREEDY